MTTCYTESPSVSAEANACSDVSVSSQQTDQASMDYAAGAESQRPDDSLHSTESEFIQAARRAVALKYGEPVAVALWDDPITRDRLLSDAGFRLGENDWRAALAAPTGWRDLIQEVINRAHGLKEIAAKNKAGLPDALRAAKWRYVDQTTTKLTQFQAQLSEGIRQYLTVTGVIANNLMPGDPLMAFLDAQREITPAMAAIDSLGTAFDSLEAAVVAGERSWNGQDLNYALLAAEMRAHAPGALELEIGRLLESDWNAALTATYNVMEHTSRGISQIELQGRMMEIDLEALKTTCKLILGALAPTAMGIKSIPATIALSRIRVSGLTTLRPRVRGQGGLADAGSSPTIADPP